MKVSYEKIKLAEKIALLYHKLGILTDEELCNNASYLVAAKSSRKQLRKDYNFLKGELK